MTPLPITRLAALTAALTLGLCAAAFAEPVLKSDITVNSEIVTVSDMFEDAGTYAEEALFRAPLPGTAGQVSLEAVRLAANKVGLNHFDAAGNLDVRVARAGILVDQDLINETIAAQLRANGSLPEGTKVDAELSQSLGDYYAAPGENPVSIEQFRYLPSTSNFSGRFKLAGQSQPLSLNGRLFFTVDAPHLTHSLAAGSVIAPDDIEMRPISVQLADAAGVPALDDIIGKQVTRQMREGILVRTADVDDPVIVARNDVVTLFLRSGPMTLTVKGQALNDAGRGDSVSVLNLASNRIVRGIAVDDGTVEVQPPATAIAALQ
ncbi:MAG: flagellar basal body P-ring formation protein FlgA [Hyphomicrobiaceae bacterium]|nr:flagellar basal body P-ring formation protein FlgA [Hyphomicrobiaceae bacterium]